MAEVAEQYVLEIQWEKPGLPAIVGPFASRDEASEWAGMNIPNGSWNAAPLAYPYLRALTYPYLRARGAREERTP